MKRPPKQKKFPGTPKQVSKLMSRIKSKNTKPELILRKKLWSLGFRYRLNSKLPGKPDIIIKKHKLVIFIDGDFWHGHNWETRKPKLKVNKEYWVNKIEYNMDRDKRNTEAIRNIGWNVIRLWEHNILKDLDNCIYVILDKINDKTGNTNNKWPNQL